MAKQGFEHRLSNSVWTLRAFSSHEPRGQEENVGWGDDSTKANLLWGTAKEPTFLSMQQTLLCAPQVTLPKALRASDILRPVTPTESALLHYVTGRDWHLRHDAPTEKFTKICKGWSPALLSPTKGEAAEIWKAGLLTPPRHPSCHGYHQPSMMLLLPLSPGTALLFILTHAGKEDFSPTSPKPVLRI